MQLSVEQEGALVECLNSRFGRAGAALSQRTGQPVLFDVPRAAIQPVARLSASLGRIADGMVASVHQAFSGPVAGDAVLMLDPASAATLKQLFTGEPAQPLGLDASSREVLTEVGNILLNACLGTFSSLLKVQVSLSVPDIDVTHLRSVVDRMADGDAERYALVVTAGFRLREADVAGDVAIVLTVQSLTRLLTAVEEWVQPQE